jgi:phage replication initiation protein
VQSAISVCVDWAAFTAPDGSAFKDLLPDCDSADFVELSHGGQGYKRAVVNGHIKVFFDGGSGMGVHVELSGQGCRQLEGNGLTDWQGYIAYLLNLGCKFSRLDIAFDDRSGLLDVRNMRDFAQRGDITSRWRKGRIMEGFTIGGSQAASGDDLGFTLYLGSKTSDAQMRAYDKAKEQVVEGHWVRVELQFRDKQAQRVVRAVSNPDTNMVRELVGVLRLYVDFKERGAASQKTRWRTVDWWDEFCCGLEKVKLSIEPMKRSVAQVLRWVEHQVGPSLAILAAAMDASPEDISDMFKELCREGRKRWKPKHMAILVGG